MYLRLAYKCYKVPPINNSFMPIVQGKAEGAQTRNFIPPPERLADIRPEDDNVSNSYRACFPR